MNDARTAWILGSAKIGEREIMVRRNESASKFVGDEFRSVRVGIAIPLESLSSEQGGDWLDAAEQVEDVVIGVMDECENAIHVLTLTTAQVRELVFYVPSNSDLTSLLQKIRSKECGQHIQMSAKKDPKWQMYKLFADSSQ